MEHLDTGFTAQAAKHDGKGHSGCWPSREPTKEHTGDDHHHDQYVYALVCSFVHGHPLMASLDTVEPDTVVEVLLEDLLHQYPYLDDLDLPVIPQALEDCGV